MKCLVLGAAGFLGQHLEYRLKEEGHFVVSVARSRPAWRKSVADEFNILDLTNVAEFHSHFWRHSFDIVYQMAGEVGGLGYIANQNHDAKILTDSLKINLHTLEAIARTQAAGRIFFASSQCVYTEPGFDPYRQERIASYGNCERDADFNNVAFAKEKLYAESLYQAYARCHGIDVRVGRLGNTYGPFCRWHGDRAKSVASLCRKVAEAPYGAPVELWGDGTHTRSFTYVDDAIEGVLRLGGSDHAEALDGNPINLASAETASIAKLFETICKVAGKILAYKSVLGPTGVSERGSDNTLLKQVLDWEPTTPLAEGLEKTYPWVRDQVLTKAKA